MALPSAAPSLDDEPYFSLFAKSESPLISLICSCTACSFSLFFRLKDLPPYSIHGKELYPIIQCQKLSQLSDEHVLMLCRILLNVELTGDNLESWQYDSFECYDDLMEFAYTTKRPIARYHDHNIYYDGFFNSWMDLNVPHFERYRFSALDEEPIELDEPLKDVISINKQESKSEDFEKVTFTQEDHEISSSIKQCEEVETPHDRSIIEFDIKAMGNKDVNDYNLNSYMKIKQVTGKELFRRTITYLILILFGKVRIEMNFSHALYPSGLTRTKILRNLRAYSSNKIKMKLCI